MCVVFAARVFAARVFAAVVLVCAKLSSSVKEAHRLMLRSPVNASTGAPAIETGAPAIATGAADA